MRPEVGHFCREINFDNLELLEEAPERIFAFACLEAGCQVIAQIPVGDGPQQSIIDFWIKNPKNPFSLGKLVEVTSTPRGRVHRHPRKHRQTANMENSGSPWTILYGEEIARLKKISGDPLSPV